MAWDSNCPIFPPPVTGGPPPTGGGCWPNDADRASASVFAIVAEFPCTTTTFYSSGARLPRVGAGRHVRHHLVRPPERRERLEQDELLAHVAGQLEQDIVRAQGPAGRLGTTAHQRRQRPGHRPPLGVAEERLRVGDVVPGE